MNIKLHILSVKTERFYSAAMDEYLKRLSRYCKISVKLHKNIDKLVKEVESEENIYVINEKGSLISSEGLAKRISSMEVSGISRATGVIAEGFEEKFKGEFKKAGISKMRMSAQLAGVVALEQIYRAYKIINGETYHK